MKQVVLRKSCGLYLTLLALTACTGVSVREPLPDNQLAYQARAEKLGAMDEWGLVAKISLDDSDRGGSGRLQWNVEGDHSELDFHGAMGRGAWHLEIGPEGATLKAADGTEQSTADVNTLVLDNLGWHIPVDALQWWVRGLEAPGASEARELDPEGLLISLDQFGWKVNFSRYDSGTGISLPKRLNASHDRYRVKLAIGRWQTDVKDAIQN